MCVYAIKHLTGEQFLNHQSWLLKCVAMELRITAANRQTSYVQRVVALLLSDAPTSLQRGIFFFFSSKHYLLSHTAVEKLTSAVASNFCNSVTDGSTGKQITSSFDLRLQNIMYKDITFNINAISVRSY